MKASARLRCRANCDGWPFENVPICRYNGWPRGNMQFEDQVMAITNLQRVEILRACCCIASADGETTDDERAGLKKLALTMGVGDASLQAMIDRATRDPEFYKAQFGVLRDEPINTLRILIESAMANGQIKQPELAVLKGLAERLGISDDDFQRTLREELERGRAG